MDGMRLGKWKQLDRTTNGADGTVPVAFSSSTLYAQMAIIFNKSNVEITIGPTTTPNLWPIPAGQWFLIPALHPASSLFNLVDWYFKAANAGDINKSVQILYL